jgi:hypothetical protein
MSHVNTISKPSSLSPKRVEASGLAEETRLGKRMETSTVPVFLMLWWISLSTLSYVPTLPIPTVEGTYFSLFELFDKDADPTESIQISYTRSGNHMRQV